MSATIFRYRATLDGATWEVEADQRDLAAFELEPFGVPFYALGTRPFTAARWMAWHAGVRAKLTPLSWDEFCTACVEVEDITPEDVTEPDPTRTVASAGD